MKFNIRIGTVITALLLMTSLFFVSVMSPMTGPAKTVLAWPKEEIHTCDAYGGKVQNDTNKSVTAKVWRKVGDVSGDAEDQVVAPGDWAVYTVPLPRDNSVWIQVRITFPGDTKYFNSASALMNTCSPTATTIPTATETPTSVPPSATPTLTPEPEDTQEPATATPTSTSEPTATGTTLPTATSTNTPVPSTQTPVPSTATPQPQVVCKPYPDANGNIPIPLPGTVYSDEFCPQPPQPTIVVCAPTAVNGQPTPIPAPGVTYDPCGTGGGSLPEPNDNPVPKGNDQQGNVCVKPIKDGFVTKIYYVWFKQTDSTLGKRVVSKGDTQLDNRTLVFDMKNVEFVSATVDNAIQGKRTATFSVIDRTLNIGTIYHEDMKTTVVVSFKPTSDDWKANAIIGPTFARVKDPQGNEYDVNLVGDPNIGNNNLDAYKVNGCEPSLTPTVIVTAKAPVKVSKASALPTAPPDTRRAAPTGGEDHGFMDFNFFELGIALGLVGIAIVVWRRLFGK